MAPSLFSFQSSWVRVWSGLPPPGVPHSIQNSGLGDLSISAWTEPGAAGVGRAATEAFVTSFLAIIMLNLVLAKVLNAINVALIDKGVISTFG